MSTETINRTPNGRDILRITREGRETYAVQPPRDNYWVERRSIRAAMIAAGWPRRMVDRDYAGVEDM